MRRSRKVWGWVGTTTWHVRMTMTQDQDRLIRLPWQLSGKESACHCRRHRFNPRSGKIPHAAELLSSWATTIESVHYSPGTTAPELSCHNYWSPCNLGPGLSNKRSQHDEKPAKATREEPPLLATTREKSTQQWDPAQPKNK